MARPKKPTPKAKTETINVRVDQALRRTYEEFAEAEDLDMSDVARRALREYARRQRQESAA